MRVFQVKFSFSPAGSGMLILDTDYDNFAAVYSCIDFPVVGKFEYAWVLTRSPLPKPDIVRATIFLVTVGIQNVDFFCDTFLILHFFLYARLFLIHIYRRETTWISLFKCFFLLTNLKGYFLRTHAKKLLKKHFLSSWLAVGKLCPSRGSRYPSLKPLNKAQVILQVL